MLRLYLALALTCLLGWLFKAHCTAGGWVDGMQYTTGCYSDAVPFWGLRGVAAGALPYLEARIEYPVLTGALIWVEGAVARWVGGADAGAVDFLNIVTLVNALFAAIILWLFARAGMPARRLWCWACAPPLILYVGHNWDLLAVLLVVVAVLLARARRDVASAGVAGLGVAAKLFPVLLLPLIGLGVLARAGEPWPRRLLLGGAVTAAAVGAWALVNVPVAGAAFDNWAEFYIFSSTRGETLAASWMIAAHLGWAFESNAARNLAASLLFVAGAGAIIALGWRRHHGRLWLLFTPVLAWFLLTNKVYSPQFDLWLYPMLLMTSRRLWPVAWFAAAGVAVYFLEFWWLGAISGTVAPPVAMSMDGIAVAAAVRAGAMLWIIADAVRSDAPEWVTHPG